MLKYIVCFAPCLILKEYDMIKLWFDEAIYIIDSKQADNSHDGREIQCHSPVMLVVYWYIVFSLTKMEIHKFIDDLTPKIGLQ